MSWKRKRSRKPLTTDGLLLKLKDGILEMEKIILKDSYTESQKIQAVNALSGLVGKYRKLIETTELIDRIEQLEQKFKLRKAS